MCTGWLSSVSVIGEGGCRICIWKELIYVEPIWRRPIYAERCWTEPIYAMHAWREQTCAILICRESSSPGLHLAC
jgi:hypothetical protein